MDLRKEILLHALAKGEIRVTFPGLKLNAADIIETESCKTLQKIKAIIENDSLDDFMCIEEILCALDEAGIGSGNRHDFG